MDHARTSDLRVSVLRGVEVWRDGVPVEIAGRRLRSLLALLALTPGVPRRAEYLADQLWNGEPPSANALQALISRLRRALGPDAVASRPIGYLLAADPARVDAVRFDRLARERTPEAAREALALAGPEPLAEFADVPDLADEARRIEAECLKLAELAESAPQPAGSGSSSTTSATSTSASAAASTARLAARGVRLIGRDRLLAEITARLATTRLLTLVGAGGAGKTSLAKAVAYARDGAVVAELAPVGAEAVAAEVLTAVGGRDLVVSDRTRRAADLHRDYRTRIAAALRDRKLLLVLDNCEHVVDAAADLAALILDRCPEVTILTTSREPLSVPGEVRLPVDPLPVPPLETDQARLGDYAAMELLLERGRAVRPDLAADGADGRALAEICRRLDGSPLALELAAARFSALTPRQVADRLDDRFRLLTGGARTALPRQQTLRAVVDWSWDLLDPQEREILGVCAVFAGGATLGELETVAAEPVLDVLERLVVKSLVVAEPRGGEMRYRLLETIREYARERLAESGCEREVRRRHALCYARFAERADRRLRGPDQLLWISRLDEEDDNLRAALAFAQQQEDADLLVRLCGALAWYRMLRGRDNDSKEEYRATVLLVERVGTRRRYAFCGLLALHAFGALEGSLSPDEGKARMRRANEAFKRVGHHSTVGVFIEMMLQLLEPKGEDFSFSGALDRAEERCVAAGDAWGTAMLNMFRARVLADEVPDDAERSARRALEMYRVIGDRWGIAESGQILGYIESLRGDHRVALAVYDEAARVAGELGAVGDMMITAIMSVWEYEYLGEHEEADRRLADAEELRESRWFSAEGTAFITLTRAALARVRGDLDSALRLMAETRRLHERGRDYAFRPQIFLESGQLCVETGDYWQAARYYSTALEAATALYFDGPEVAQCTEGLAGAALGLGESAAAAKLLGAASAARQIPLPDTRSRDALRTKAAVRAALGPDAFDHAYAEGRALDRGQVLQLAKDHAARYGAAGEH